LIAGCLKADRDIGGRRPDIRIGRRGGVREGSGGRGVAGGVIGGCSTTVKGVEGRRYIGTKIARALRGIRRASGDQISTNVAIPFFVPPEEELVFLDWAGQVIAPVVAAKRRLCNAV